MNNPYNELALVNKYINNEKPIHQFEFDFISKYFNRDMKICEIGFGTGNLLNHFLLQKFTSLCGIDSSKLFVENAKKRFKEKIKIIKNDLSCRIICNLTFNGIIAFNFITAIQNELKIDRVIRNIFKLLEKNGLLIIKSFYSNDDKTINSIQAGISVKIWIPNNDDFCNKISNFGLKHIDSLIIKNDGNVQIINVFRKE